MRSPVIVAAGLGLALLVAGCGSSSAGTAASSSSKASASPAAKPKYDQFVELAKTRGLTAVTTKRNEADSVSANLCDNSDADMASLATLLVVLGPDPLLEDIALVDTYCPDKKDALLAASVTANKAKEAAAASAAAAAAAAVEAAKPKPADFTIGIKILRQACFGSAGCNVSYRIDPKYTGTGSISTGSYEITYTVTGGEDGPQIDTFTIDNGNASFDQEASTSTKSSSVHLVATVTEVSSK